ncbi:helix-turn-helix domain-containing protein [Microbacteriaceae bacterium VKM Ac-2854]|nr:helix-turn-helix domain-containing protein [Microbacteriaceae bacterium VKM Ac-2854]
MDNHTSVREFLSTRRARISPEQSGLPAYGGKRRVPGLRREEVAMLAGVSVDYYTRLERGNLSGVSESVLDALARALQLDEAETAHLFDLARAAAPGLRRRATQPLAVRPSLQRILDSMVGAPAWVRNGRMDFMAANELGFALYNDYFDDRTRPANSARFLFLDPRAREFFPDWETNANDVVAILRGEAGRNPYDKKLTDLIGELSTRSTEFRVRWAAHNVRFHRSGLKRINHSVVGALELTYEAMEFPGLPGLTMFAYTAEPASSTEEKLKLLASWAATRAVQESNA